MSEKYKVVSGKPGKMVRISCVVCNKTLMEMPTECVVKPDRFTVIDNAKCMMSTHEIKVEILD